MLNPLAATTALLLGSVLALPVASQPGTTSRPGTTNKPGTTGKPGTTSKPDFQERQRRARAHKQARRWVTFLELDNRRAEGANGLLRLGSDAVPALVAALSDPRPVVVQRAAHILRALGSQAAAGQKQLQALARSENPVLANAARYALAGIHPGNITLVADYSKNQVLELDMAGKVLRRLTGALGPWDAERLPNGNYLICAYNRNKVVEMTPESKVVWTFAKVNNPREAQRLPSGNTLIADGNGHRVLEVDRAGKIVWKYSTRNLNSLDAERLPNGNTLIADGSGHQVIEVSPEGKVVWKYKHHNQQAHDVDRLANGNTLITIYGLGKVIEVSPEGKVVHELTGLRNPLDADRLPNGHTLVAQAAEVAEYDAKGKKIWSQKATYPAEVSRY